MKTYPMERYLSNKFMGKPVSPPAT
eukprot:COSAG02_NODE_42133_length_387_cov_1.072917_1_plen_24_part_10